MVPLGTLGVNSIDASIGRSAKKAAAVENTMGGFEVFRKILSTALLTTALYAGAAQAKDTIVWWDFLGGGDGVRMKSMIE